MKDLIISLVDKPLIIFLIPLLPLIAFIIQTFIGRKLPKNGALVSVFAIVISAIISTLLFIALLIKSDPHFAKYFSYSWFQLSNFNFKAGIILDNISITMLFMVTVVSSLIHIYSLEYMAGDRKYGRFFGHLSLFTFSMIGLTICDNLLCLYVFWELVGLASYLLIGFWFEKLSAANACKKAFLTTRLGDIGMFIGILIIFSKLGSFSYTDLFTGVKNGVFSNELLTVVCLCLFAGAMGKSAQFPLHIWLPDAMEGPTPVSALIHAATMVAAGVFMVVRLFPIFTFDALTFIAFIGTFSAIFSAIIATTQTDIKKVLAYSTISQLGFMMAGLGACAVVGSFFHLITHGFFKALLFLCAGSVIHMTHCQDINRLGGLRRKMPVTYWTMLIATLAISGLPPFSGFFSKDLIIEGAFGLYEYARGIYFLIPLLLLTGCALTTFYMFRLLFLTFLGEPREEEIFHHAKEATKTITIPLIILAIFSTCIAWGGWFQKLIIPPEHLVKNVIFPEPHSVREGFIPLVAILFSALGILLSILFYHPEWSYFSPVSWAKKLKLVYKVVHNKFYIDELVNYIIVKPFLKLSELLANIDLFGIDGIVNTTAKITRDIGFDTGLFDNKVVDGLVNTTAEGVSYSGYKLRILQTGFIKQYITWILAGTIVFIFIFYLCLFHFVLNI